ncbi:Ltp family lipoprotein [Holdemanella biformis]|uniref:Ltp family lipoprotein n=1 Tax=Holdemanella biformis TaxID=1735 RepID=UPI002676D11A|nr:Ltp family lipoprotein [Holdemanella biformis]
MLALSMCTGCTSYKERVKANNQTEEITDRESDDLKAKSFEIGDFTIYLPEYFQNVVSTKEELSFRTDEGYPILTITLTDMELNSEAADAFMDALKDRDDFMEDTDTSYGIRTLKRAGRTVYYSEVTGNLTLNDDDSDNDTSTPSKCFIYLLSNNNKTSFISMILIQPNEGLKYDYENEFDNIVDNVVVNDKKEEEEQSNTNSTTSSSSSTTTPSTSSNASTPSPTTGEKNALRTAREYLSFSAFSYTGLIKQLEYEGYSTEEATYAADNCNANWNLQAAKSAKEYLDISSFSRQGLIDQLIYEGYTQEQAEYGVTQNGY